MPLDNIPEKELAEQAKGALIMFIKFSDLWLKKVDYRPDTLDGRKFKNRMFNANNVAKPILARLNDEILHRWEIGQKSSISS